MTRSEQAFFRLLGIERLGDRITGGYALTEFSLGPVVHVTIEHVASGERVRVWLRRAEDDSGSFGQTERFKVGYFDTLGSRGGLALLEEICERVATNESRLSVDEYHSLFEKSDPRNGLTLSDGGETVEIRVTLRCNESCPFCNTDDDADNVFETPQEAARAIQAAAELGAKRVSLSGGEPTLVRELPELIGFAHELGLAVEVQTNGVAWASEKLWNSLTQLPESLFVSFHTQRPERLPAITGTHGTFERKIRGIQMALSRGVRVSLNFVVTTLNLDELSEFPGFVADTFGRAIELVVFSIVAPTGRMRRNPHLLPRARDVAPLLEEALLEAESNGLEAIVPEVCGLPVCVLPHMRSRFVAYREKRVVQDLPVDRAKRDSCRRCLFDRYCLGPWKRYVEVYGFEEFRPIERWT